MLLALDSQPSIFQVEFEPRCTTQSVSFCGMNYTGVVMQGGRAKSVLCVCVAGLLIVRG
jgi:hypothetical protein